MIKEVSGDANTPVWKLPNKPVLNDTREMRTRASETSGDEKKKKPIEKERRKRIIIGEATALEDMPAPHSTLRLHPLFLN